VKKSLFLGISFVVIVMILVSACSTTTTTDNDVKALINEKCGTCHSTDIVFTANYSQSQWSTVIDQMITRGAKVTDDEKAMMIDWLVANQ
jgi:hypothetical protein